MPKEKKEEPERSPEQAAVMARQVMGRMLATPPTPHVVNKKTRTKNEKSRKK
jgi:hypothetical protein